MATKPQAERRAITAPAFDHNKNLFELLDFTFEGVHFYQAAKADDNVVNFKDWNKAIPLFLMSTDALSGLDQIDDEWRSSTTAQQDEVFAYFKQQFKLERTDVEEMIERGIDIARVNIDYFKFVAGVLRKK